ncbi:anti-sigma factor family protein, partial [Streptomyces canus]|uniref:anti-sigma factor family protein n=1 Tax=Streptomyces canus TaxID=58343 RepID=UPI00382EF6D7
ELRERLVAHLRRLRHCVSHMLETPPPNRSIPRNVPHLDEGFQCMTSLRSPRACRWWAECRERLRHLRLRGAVGPYADGQLTGARQTRVAAHVARCWACSGELLALRLIKASIRDHPHRAPTSLTEVRIRRLADRIARTPPPPGV